MDVYLVIDTGSSSMKSFLFDKNGRILNRHQVPYSMASSDGDAMSMDASLFRNALYHLVSQTFQETDSSYKVQSISFTSQRSSLLPVDKDGNPLSEIFMWYDKRSSRICEKMLKQSGRTIYEISGMRLSPLCTAAKILWLKKEFPSLYDSAFKLIGIQDYLLFLVSGVFATDTSLASRTAILDVANGVWSKELLSLYEIDENKLCSLYAPGSIIGNSTPEFSALTGCPSGTPVITAGGDQQCSILGQGITSPGTVAINSGTGSFLCTIMNTPSLHPDSGLSLNCAIPPSSWVLEASVLASGSAYQWMNHTFYPDVPSAFTANQEISSISAGADGLICIPTLTGTGTPDWDSYAKGTFFNIGMHHTKAHMARSLLEGIVAEICNAYHVLEGFVPDIHSIQSSGGLTNFPLFNQMLADMLNQPVAIADCPDSTATGALIITLVSLKVIASCNDFFQEQRLLFSHTYEPDLTNYKIYQKQAAMRNRIADAIRRNTVI